MKSYNWLTLPVWNDAIYPNEIMELAKRAGVDPKSIAERDNIPSGLSYQVAFRRDHVEMIHMMSQSPLFPTRTLLEFEDGYFEIIDMPIERVVKIVDKFLLMNSEYKPTSKFEPLSETEVMKMGFPDEEDDDEN